MSAKAAALILAIAMAAVLLDCALGATITVGSPGGWDQSTDLKTWATSQTFSIGDTLVFQYLPSHDVLEVSKADYDACLASTPINSHTGGSTTVPLTVSGKRYFICGTAGHCAQGMKLEVDVGAPTAAAPATPAANAPKSAEAPATDAPTLADAPVADAPSVSNAASPSPAASTLQRTSPSSSAGTKLSAAATFASWLLVLRAVVQPDLS
ncbi:hypothetical protein Taro_052852 [Colocasia esculenta]|uniref:Phytocyanin domain-containing protein n=1 Tax=Colocasia esculenta TaxID=4460 RepID=A0A843XJQ7_COLES|nr:hypothetical protein [Colocasia esculenta]